MPIRRLHKKPAALEITAFLNLIVVLVPFLLSTAVFSRMAVLQLTLPAQTSGVETLKGDLQLEIVVRPDALEVGDRIGGLMIRSCARAPAHRRRKCPGTAPRARHWRPAPGALCAPRP